MDLVDAASPSYQFFEDSIQANTGYLVSFKLAKGIAFCWLVVLGSYLHVLYSDEFTFSEDILHFDTSVNERIVEYITTHQLQLQISSIISFIVSIIYFGALSVWVLLLEDFGQNAIYCASFIQLLGPISAILQLASMLMMIIICTAIPQPSDVITLVFFIQAFCYQISFAFFGIISFALGLTLSCIRRKKRKCCINFLYFSTLTLQFIFSILFVGVFLKNGLIKLPFSICSVIWYVSTIFTGIVAFAEVCWLTLYDPEVFAKQKFDDLAPSV